MADESYPWQEGPDHKDWQSLEVSQKILGEVKTGRGMPIPRSWVEVCARRVREMREDLQKFWVGLYDPTTGYITDWILAALIARENLLLLGPPGVAKSEIATRVCELLGLKYPEGHQGTLDPLDGNRALPQEPEPTQPEGHQGTLDPLDERDIPSQWWEKRRLQERQHQKYFHYLLSRFTQPEELFGPIEISLLRQGILARVNFGLLTGPGVRAAFLDEIFKASSSILNTLLTLTHEGLYFNWGGMVQSDLVTFIGASNELPGGFGSGVFGVGSGADDFQTLYAFLDRFPLRLLIPTASGTSNPSPQHSDLAEASRKAIAREASKFTTGKSFRSRSSDMPSINDILLLGRACLQQSAGHDQGLFNSSDLKKFEDAFYGTAVALQTRGTAIEAGAVTWTISPRKLKALYKIALAHALVCDNGLPSGASVVEHLGGPNLHAFSFIWDSPVARSELLSLTLASIHRYYE